MKAIYISFIQMIKYTKRDLMLFFAAFAPILTGLFFKFAIPFIENLLTLYLNKTQIIAPYFSLGDIFFALLTPTMFCFICAMVTLEENDEKTARYLFITPLGKIGYLVSRFGLSSFVAFLVTLILLPIFNLSHLSVGMCILLSIVGTLQGLIIALIVVTFSTNKLEGMALTKLSSLLIVASFVPYFIKHNIQYVLSFIPSFWLGKAMSKNQTKLIFVAFFIEVIWIFILTLLYRKKK